MREGVERVEERVRNLFVVNLEGERLPPCRTRSHEHIPDLPCEGEKRLTAKPGSSSELLSHLFALIDAATARSPNLLIICDEFGINSVSYT